jgi:large subunit ribosomal protein L24
MQAQEKKMKLKVKKGDTVIVLTGKSKGTKGEVTTINRETGRVTVAGANLVKRHTKPTQTNPGGIVSQEASIHISNVALLDPKSGKPTKVGYKIDKDGTKTRVARKSGTAIG